jgi:hypothetical protein
VLILAQALFAAALLVLLALQGSTIVVEADRPGPIISVVFFGIIIAFYLWQQVEQFRDRTPQLTVAPEGLYLPAAIDQPIPWRKIWHAQTSHMLLGGGQVAMRVDPEIFLQMRFGQRFLGANVVKGRGGLGNIAIVAQGYDTGADKIMAAIRGYWPPADGGNDDEDDERP